MTPEITQTYRIAGEATVLSTPEGLMMTTNGERQAYTHDHWRGGMIPSVAERIFHYLYLGGNTVLISGVIQFDLDREELAPVSDMDLLVEIPMSFMELTHYYLPRKHRGWVMKDPPQTAKTGVNLYFPRAAVEECLA
jgi:hypothetical protein